MRVEQAVRTRKATRAMLSTPLSEQEIRELLELAARAPSWANSQPWQVYVATAEKLTRLKARWRQEFSQGIPAARPDIPAPGHGDWAEAPRCTENILRLKQHRLEAMAGSKEQFDQQTMERMLDFYGAPVCVYLGLPRRLGAYSFYDVGAFGQTLMLAAAERGIQSMPAFSLVYFGDILHQELGVPEDISVFMGICLGYADETHPMNRFDSERMPRGQFMHHCSGE